MTSGSPEQTHALGVKLGRLLQPGDVIGLAGELGAGKTALVRGIAEGAGVAADEVSSPTFTIVQTYAGRVRLHHADLYRLSSADELYATGFFDLLEDGGAALVEWVDNVPLAVPMLRVEISMVDASSRRLEISASGGRSEALMEAWTGSQR
ncbi:MAG: tRNA (adenosine(37)-N6)-threonylcarbamoyltransferase complex ATPase subunit type 1 TsaE [Archangiaceae bacterium]|nr:tRNA (adenosine(37)-N6)-threonylcarbamoyltransferase complex ATPase subunit type 1 TsaE [Archangiaceae bacterium]